MKVKINNIITFLFSFLVFQCIVVPTILDIIKLITIVLLLFFGCWNFKIKIPDKIYVWLFTIIILYNIVLTVVGYLNYGDSVFVEAKLTVVYVTIFFFFTFIIWKKEDLPKFNKILEIGVFIESIYFFYVFLGGAGFTPYFGDFLHQEFTVSIGVGIIKIGSQSVFIYSFMLPYLLYKSYLSFKIKKVNLFLYINTFLALLAVIVTFRRGFIIASFVSISALFLYLEKNKFRIITVTFICIIIFLLGLKIFISNFSSLNYAVYVNGIITSFDFKNDHSNQVRTQQSFLLNRAILKKPLIGHGIGANLGSYKRGDNPAEFELQYLKMVFATGLIGLLLNASLFFYVLMKSLRKIKGHSFYLEHLAPVCAGFLSLVITNVTNPIICQLAGYFLYFYIFYFLNDLPSSIDQLKGKIDSTNKFRFVKSRV